MKSQVLRTSIVALLAVAAASAQSAQMHANIPFGFVAGGSTFRAGEYVVDQKVPGTIIVTPVEGKARGIIVETLPVVNDSAAIASKLVFHRYGNVLLLSQIWTQGYSAGRETAPSARYRELRASNKIPDTVVVNAE